MADKFLEKRHALPLSYVEFIELRDGGQGYIDDQLIVVWDRESIQSLLDRAPPMDGLGERWFPFGSDGSGEVLCFDLQASNDKIFLLPFIGLVIGSPVPLNVSFSTLAANIRSNDKFPTAFRAISALSGCFTLFTVMGLGTVVYCRASLDAAKLRGMGWFCLISYLFLQFSTASYQRQRLRTIRARVYWWLLALFPLWSLPAAWATVRIVFDFVEALT